MTDCYIVFNINDHVRVRLTDYGRKVHRQNHVNFWKSVNHPNPPKYRPPEEDDEGWSKWQLWSLMKEFGCHMEIGFRNVFDTTIELAAN